MICRLCLNEKQKFLLLKTVGEDGEDVAGIIGKYFNLPLDIISHVICTECWNRVYNFHTFYLLIEEKQRKFRLESRSLVSTTTDREKGTNAEGILVLVETEDATNTKAGKDAAPLQTEDYEMVDFEFLQNDEDEPCIQAEEDGYLGVIDDESKASTYGLSEETDDEYNMYMEDKDDNEAETLNLQEDTDDTTDDMTHPLNSDPSMLPTNTREYLCNKPGTSEEPDVVKYWKAFKEQQTHISNARRKREEANLRIASNVGDLQCDLCAEPLESFEELLQHFRETHDCRGYVKCCNKRFFRRFVYADHLELHVNPDFFKCEHCNKVLSTRNSYNAHLSHFHPAKGGLKYPCPHCPMKFAIRSRLTVHIKRRHTDGEFKCEECNKIYKTLEALKSHQAIIHRRAKTTICYICGKSFLCKSSYEKHKANVHREIECTSEKSSVHQDVKETQLECSTCHKWFKNLTGLRTHNKNYHKDGQTEYKCDLCGVVKKNRILLNTHKYYHHADRRFPCSYCEKAFKTKIKLKEHESIHTGIPNYRCELCDRTFNARCNLASHKKTVHRDVYK